MPIGEACALPGIRQEFTVFLLLAFVLLGPVRVKAFCGGAKAINRFRIAHSA